MPSQAVELETLRRDVANSPLHVVLVGFACLDARYDELEEKKELSELKSQAPPLIQKFLKQTLGEQRLSPRLSRPDGEVRDVLARGLAERLAPATQASFMIINSL